LRFLTDITGSEAENTESEVRGKDFCNIEFYREWGMGNGGDEGDEGDEGVGEEK
jgi:hypothetical protein